MEYVGAVDVFKSTESLVKERLEVSIGEWLARPNLRTGVKLCIELIGMETDARWHGDQPPSILPGVGMSKTRK